MSANRVFAPLMAFAALGLSAAAVVPVSAVASGSQIITCQKHGGKASLAHGGKCKSGETKTAWQSAVPSPKTSAIYTCKSGSGSERLVSRSTKCAKHERKLAWYQVKPANGQSKSGTLGTTTVTPPTAPVPPPALPAIIPSGPESPETPVESTKVPNFAVTLEQRVKGTSAYTKAAVAPEAGQTLEYEITVTNTGETALVLGAPKDTKCTNLLPTGEQELAIGASTTYTCTHRAHLLDIGSYGNVASASAAGKEVASNKVVAQVSESKGLAALKTKLSEAIASTSGAKAALTTAKTAEEGIAKAEQAVADDEKAEQEAEAALHAAEEALPKDEAAYEPLPTKTEEALTKLNNAQELVEIYEFIAGAYEEEIGSVEVELAQVEVELAQVEHELKLKPSKTLKAELEKEAKEDKEYIEFLKEVIGELEEELAGVRLVVQEESTTALEAEQAFHEAETAEKAAAAKISADEKAIAEDQAGELEAQAHTAAAEEALEKVQGEEAALKAATKHAEEVLAAAEAAQSQAAQEVKAAEAALATE